MRNLLTGASSARTRLLVDPLRRRLVTMHPRLDEVRDEERDGKEADDGEEFDHCARLATSARTYFVIDEGSDTPSSKVVTNFKLTHYRAAKSLDRV